MSEDFGLPKSFAGVTNYSFPLRVPKPLQHEAINLMLKRWDLLLKVKNGKGVEVFGPGAVQIVSRELRKKKNQGRNSSIRPHHTHRNRQPRAMIFEPTKESAEETFAVIQRFANLVTDLNLLLGLAVDGMDVEKLKESFRSVDGVDILVGTPSELKRLYEAGGFMLHKCRCFVVDEAYTTLTGASREIVERFFPGTQQEWWPKRRTVICSSVLGLSEIREFARRRMVAPTYINLLDKEALPETAFHAVVRIDPTKDSSWRKIDRQIVTDGVHSQDDFDAEKLDKNTLSEAVKILRGEYIVRAIDAHNMDKAVIICRTRMDCDNLEEYLKYLDEEKYSCACYSTIEGDNLSKGTDVAHFEDNWSFKFLVCTEEDLRQVRLTGLPFMINASCPSDGHDYLRRVEKIGSIKSMGLVINLVAAVPEKVWHHGEWCPSKGADCWNTESWENKGCCVWQNASEGFIRVENELDIKFHEIGPDMEFDGQRNYVNQRQLEEDSLLVVDGESQKCNGNKEQQILEKDSSVDPVAHLCCTSEKNPNKRLRPDDDKLPHAVEGAGQKYNGNEQPQQQQLKKNGTEGPGGKHSSSCTSEGSANKRFRPNDDNLLHVLEVDGHKYNGHEEQQQLRKKVIEDPVGKDSSSCTPEGSANKRFRPNDDVSISSTPDEMLTTEHAAVGTGIRVAICHRVYPAFELTNEQLVTLQRSIMKAVELVPDDGPQVRFQECVQKFGWLLVVCADVESCSWLWNTVNYLQPWEGARLRVVLEKDLLPQTPVWEAFVPDDSKIRLTSEEVLTRLKKMNRGLDTNKWKVLSNRKSRGGQFWTFIIDMKSMKELESVDCRPFFGFGRVQFECKSKIEYPRPRDSPAITHTARDCTSSAGPVQDASSAATPMEADASKEDNSHMVELVEPLKSVSSASEPKESDDSAEPLNRHRAITKQLLKSDTSVTKPTEDTPIAEPIQSEPAEEKSTHVAESIEDESSAPKTLESCISAAEPKESDNSATKPLSSENSVVEPLEGDTYVAKLIEDGSFAVKSLVSGHPVTEQFKSGIPLRKAIQGDTSVAEPIADNASTEKSSHASESTKDESSVIEPLEGNTSAIEPKESDNSATKSLESETSVVQPIKIDTLLEKLIETKSSAAEPLDSSHAGKEQSKCDTSVTKPIEDDSSVAEPIERNSAKEKSAQVTGSREDESSAREPFESGTSTTETKRGDNSSTEALNCQTSIESIAGDTSEAKLEDGTYVAEPVGDNASNEEGTENSTNCTSVRESLENAASITEAMECSAFKGKSAHFAPKENDSSEPFDTGRSVTEQLKNDTFLEKPMLKHDTAVAKLIGDSVSKEESMDVDLQKSAIEPLESNVSSQKPKESDKSPTEPLESETSILERMKDNVSKQDSSLVTVEDSSAAESSKSGIFSTEPSGIGVFVTESLKTEESPKSETSSTQEKTGDIYVCKINRSWY